jgi:predicted PurR-regulated permease PerM
MLKKFIHCKKGIAEVIGSLIIILIVTIAGVGVYAYSLNAISSSSNNLTQKAMQYSEQAQERFEIIAAWSNNQDIKLTILNYGQTDLSITAVYVNGTAVMQYLNGRGTKIGTDQLITIEFTSPLSIQSNAFLDILAISERGGKNTVLYQT